MKLEIITPEQVYFTGEISSVTLPGTTGSFTVWENHAPMISTLGIGAIIYKEASGEKEIEVAGGVVEVNKNVVTVCLELV